MAKRRRSKADRERRLRELEIQRERNVGAARRLLILAVIVAIVAVAWWTFGGGEEGPGPAAGLTINAQGEAEIPQSEVTEKARYYSIEDNGVDVRFFVVRGDDGRIRVAMDACDVCYAAKRGYHQDGDDMVCNSCGNSYPTEGIGTENLKGGCWPSYLPMRIEDGKVIIKASDLLSKRYMFA